MTARLSGVEFLKGFSNEYEKDPVLVVVGELKTVCRQAERSIQPLATRLSRTCDNIESFLGHTASNYHALGAEVAAIVSNTIHSVIATQPDYETSLSKLMGKGQTFDKACSELASRNWNRVATFLSKPTLNVGRLQALIQKEAAKSGLPKSKLRTATNAAQRCVMVAGALLYAARLDAGNYKPADHPLYDAWPPDDGWNFAPGEFAYKRQRYPLAGKRLDLLKVFTETPTALTAAELRKRISPDYDISDETIRSHICNLRKVLRNALSLPRLKNPIPNVERGGHRAWKLDV